MPAIVTDQFRILNAGNFVDSITDDANSYYVFVGLSNATSTGQYKKGDWDDKTPNPVDNFDYHGFISDNMSYGKRITSANVKRLAKRYNWTRGAKYEMYRHDYSVDNKTSSGLNRLYDSKYYVMNSDYKVYICIDNGTTGLSTTPNASLDEPNFTDLEPSKAGSGGDGYVWKYLFTVTPSDIIKFDSTDYISLPSNWSSSTDAQVTAVRNNGDSSVNDNQIKKVFIKNRGDGYSTGSHELNILGDGSGGKVVVDVDTNGHITNTVVSAGGKGYSFGVVDTGSIRGAGAGTVEANLVPIIPPSKGHGFDIYKELGADKVLVYARFDDSTKDFPTNTTFAQIGIVKNPTTVGTASSVFVQNQYSSLSAFKFSSVTNESLTVPAIGQRIHQTTPQGTAQGYIASYDRETKVLKYIQDRTLYMNPSTNDTQDHAGISTTGNVLEFYTADPNSPATVNTVVSDDGFTGTIDRDFTGISTNPSGNKLITLGLNFTYGHAPAEINKGSGEIIYIDNRPEINRNSRQKEDVKIILEF
tara:strand:- start:9442 stop:11028 length:1587 start_codon:yes stop_codon:yes gene_type:complete